MSFSVDKCPSCGGDLNITIDQDYFFCPFCGTKVVRETVSHDEPSKEVTTDQDKVSRRKKILENVGGTLLVICILVGVYFLVGPTLRGIILLSVVAIVVVAGSMFLIALFGGSGGSGCASFVGILFVVLILLVMAFLSGQLKL